MTQNEFSGPCEGSSTSKKEGSLSWLLQDLTEVEKDLFEERACILEFDQGLTRAEAEKKALILILKQRSYN